MGRFSGDACRCAVWRVAAGIIVFALLTNDLAWAAAKPLDASAARHKIEARGLGKSVKVTETDGRVATGVILSIRDDSFSVKTRHSPQPTEIPFSQVAQVQGTGMSTGTKIWIGVGIAAVVAVVAAAVAVRSAVPSVPGLGSL